MMNEKEFELMERVLKDAKRVITAFYAAEDDAYEAMIAKSDPELFRVFDIILADYDNITSKKQKLEEPECKYNSPVYDEDKDEFIVRTPNPKVKGYDEETDDFVTKTKTPTFESVYSKPEECINKLKEGEIIQVGEDLLQAILKLLSKSKESYLAECKNDKLKVNFF